MAAEETNSFARRYHCKAALYFGVGCIEGFLNRTMRDKMTRAGADEKEINQKLLYTKFPVKLSSWPAELAIQKVDMPTNFQTLLEPYKAIRNEVTHPKNRDHAIYQKMDEIVIVELPALVAEFIVKILESRKEPFPCWLLGWNQINPDTEVILSSNRDFISWLRRDGYGYDIPQEATYDSGWERTHMVGYEQYKQMLARLPKEHCQFENPICPAAPRFCQKWWDAEHIKTCGKR